MFVEILINVAPRETRVAILEDGQLSELFVERADRQRLVGDLFLGRVNAVLPGMQAAFVELGLEKSGFLHVSDVVEPNLDEFEGGEDGGRDAPDRRGPSRYPPIDELLRKGQEILVQVSKEPIGGKGPRITSQVTLAGRYLVLLPYSNHLGVSRRIESRAERSRLREVGESIRPDGMGLIVRTVAEGREESQLRADVEYLARLWKRIQKDSSKGRAPLRIHQELDLTAGLIRDVFRDDVDSLVIDGRDEHRQIVNYLQAISPEMVSRVRLHTDEVPLFDAYQVEREIEKTMHRKVGLRRGGFIVIEHTEALVAVDVNTGKFRGGRDQEDTILQTNMEAAREIARQLRLRDFGGIIVIDFIDMDSEDHRRRVYDELRTAMRQDRSRTKILNISELGLVEMTRQRVRPSLMQFMSEPCPYCDGAGRVFSHPSMRMKVERWLRRAARLSRNRPVRLRMHPDHARHLREDDPDRLIQRLQRELRIRVDIEADPTLTREDLRVVAGDTGQDVTQEFTA